jgi:predicted nucleic acid-binding protein
VILVDTGPIVALLRRPDQHHERCLATLRALRDRDRSMDFADAALLRVAEREGIDTVFTVDRKDFAVYRLSGRRRLKMLP